MRKNFPYDGDQPNVFYPCDCVLCACTKDRSNDYLKNIIIKVNCDGKNHGKYHIFALDTLSVDKKWDVHLKSISLKKLQSDSTISKIDNDYRERYGKILETYDPDHVVENAFKYSSEQY